MTYVESAWIAASAAAFFEAVPFLLGAALLQRAPFLRALRAAPYLGCGCGTGPSARSLPAALLTAMSFGPWVAAARWVAATALGNVRPPRDRNRTCHPEPIEGSPLAALAALWPAVLSATAASMLAGVDGISALAPAPALIAGGLAGLAASPCALGIPAVAAALRAVNPSFALGFLCVAGIADIRAMIRTHHHARPQHDALAYAIAALACALVALRCGAQLVHPYIAFALAPSAIAFAILAFAHRTQTYAPSRIAPAIMLAGVFIAAPPPEYHATETTLANVFAGERVIFTGVATQTHGVTTIVRFAITCCRADASPVVVRLARATPQLHGWVRAEGAMIHDGSGYALSVHHLQSIERPNDPFVYR